MRLKERISCGSELVEVAILGAIAFCLSITAFMFFGENLQKIFQGDNSPIIVSSNLKDSSDLSDAQGAGARTNTDKSLVTTTFVTKSNIDKGIASEIALETTGAAGGDAAIGGTYLVEDPDALTDGDPNTTGNTLLDAALAAKKSADKLLSQANSIQNQANYLIDTVNNLQKIVTNEQSVLGTLQSQVLALTKDLDTVNANLATVIGLKASLSGASVDIQDALDSINGLNADAVNQTQQNLLTGTALKDLNDDYNTAYDDYTNLKNTYDSGWVETCDTADPPVCTSENTSGITPEDVAAAEAQANLLLSNVNGQLTGLNTQLTATTTEINALQTEAATTQAKAEQLLSDAKATLKQAFYKDDLFDVCGASDVACYVNVANNAMATAKSVKNKKAAENAIALLESSSAAFNDVAVLNAKIATAQNNQNQIQAVITSIQNNTELTLTPSNITPANLVATNDASLDYLLNADAYVQTLTAEITALEQSLINTSLLVDKQTAYITTLNSQITTTNQDALKISADATTVSTSAQQAVSDALSVIDAIVTYPDEV